MPAAAPGIEIPEEASLDTPKQDTPGSPIHVHQKPEVHVMEPTKRKTRAKTSKKRKLKRGKTASVALKRTYESDVEDDVIWIDERPLHAESEDKSELNDNHQASLLEDDGPGQENGVGEKFNSESVTDSTTSNPHPSEPKKRGRKRKKTAEQMQIAQEEETRIAERKTTSRSRLQDISNTARTLNADSDDDQETQASNTKTERSLYGPLDNGIQSATEPMEASTPVKAKIQNEHHQDVVGHTEMRTNQEVSLDPNTSTSDKDLQKGPDKHSPISATSRVPYRVGLSRRARIAPLLKIVKR